MLQGYTFIKCWLVSGINPNTQETYYRFSSRVKRTITSSFLELEDASYSKWTGPTTKEPIHTVFANDMNEQLYAKAIQLNGSNEFYFGIPDVDTDDIRIITEKEFLDATVEDVPTVQDTMQASE
tara:strand:- start:2 stop:373 length:372 start_codon:yes stop_codon:yes gene_type:complete